MKRNSLLLYLCVFILLTGCGSTEFLQGDSVMTVPATPSIVAEVPAAEADISEVDRKESLSTDMIEGNDADAVSLQEEQGYYYEKLSETEQEIYAQVYRALLNRNEVAVSTLSEEELEKIFFCVLNDHPEIFYSNSYVYTIHQRPDERIVKLTFKGQYLYDEEECAKRMELIEKEADRILSGIPKDATDFEIIKYIFDTLVLETEYVADSPDNQNICSVFMNHESTCQGYAKATQYLLMRAGITATFIGGEVAEGSHAWNLVMSDGAWYYLDTTWGDVDYQSTKENEIDKEVLPINYDYFLITSDRLYETHTPSTLVPLPACVATADNYYIHEGLYLTGLDTEILHDIFQTAYERGDDVVQFRCANDAVYEQIANYLLEEQHIFDFVNALEAVPYYDNPQTDTFCFWL